MAKAVRISEELLTEAKKFSRLDHRSVAGQIEHWARLGKCVEENPDLTHSLLKEILLGLEELAQGEQMEFFLQTGKKVLPILLRETKVPVALNKIEMIKVRSEGWYHLLFNALAPTPSRVGHCL